MIAILFPICFFLIVGSIYAINGAGFLPKRNRYATLDPKHPYYHGASFAMIRNRRRLQRKRWWED